MKQPKPEQTSRMAVNLAKLPAADRQRIELDKQAALLAYQGKMGKKTGDEVRAEIAAMAETDRKYLVERLNFYWQQNNQEERSS